MKIGLVAPVWYPIPPQGYGGIELVVSLLAEGLVNRGHNVTLFASGDSKTKANLAYCFANAPSEKIGQVYPDLLHAVSAYCRAEEFDLIHDHSGMIGPALGAFSQTPCLHTLHGPATPEARRLYSLLNFGLYYNAISQYQRSQFGQLNFVGTIYNAIDLTLYPFNPKKEDFLLFLGRMNQEKGAHLAVEVANRLNKRLVMVTKMTEPHEKIYFEKWVKPRLTKNIEIIGQIDVKIKADFFARAYCTLFPIQWPEPFGLVMIESMATGTPVVAMGYGAVPEVVADNKTGFITYTVEDMVQAVKKVDRIDPYVCRRYAEERFSQQRMVLDYERAYAKILELEVKKKSKSSLRFGSAEGPTLTA